MKAHKEIFSDTILLKTYETGVYDGIDAIIERMELPENSTSESCPKNPAMWWASLKKELLIARESILQLLQELENEQPI